MRLLSLLFVSLCLFPAELIPVTSPAIYFSPYNTDSDGNGPVGPNNVRTGSTRASWIYAGAYLKTRFTGSSASLRIDIRSMNPAGAPPKFRWTVDGGPMQTTQAAASATTLDLANGLPPGTHTLQLFLAATDANYDRWQKPEQVVHIEGLLLDEGATAMAPEHIASRRAIFFGDSITEGAWVLGNSNRVVNRKYVDWVAHSDATQAWPRYLAEVLDVEFGLCGSGGMSWLRGSHAGIPALPESWRFHYKDRPRSFTPAPDFVFVNMGTNDGPRDTAAAAAQWLRDVRQAIPAPAEIVVIVPFAQTGKAHLEQAAQSAGDKHVQVVDLGPRWSRGIRKYGTPTLESHDGLHPNVEANGLFAALLAAALASRL